MNAPTMKREWAMPHRSTFSIRPIATLISETVPLFGVGWIDPFAGWASPAEVTNDLNPDTPADFHMTALDFLRQFDDESVDGVLFDPPYSPRQVSECYQQIGRETTAEDTRASFWSDCKIEIARITRPCGRVMCFGWNSNGIGKTRGFVIERVLTVAHGGHHNDTIVTVERQVATPAAVASVAEDEVFRVDPHLDFGPQHHARLAEVGLVSDDDASAPSGESVSVVGSDLPRLVVADEGDASTADDIAFIHDATLPAPRRTETA